jgi:hypothetical protein
MRHLQEALDELIAQAEMNAATRKHVGDLTRRIKRLETLYRADTDEDGDFYSPVELIAGMSGLKREDIDEAKLIKESYRRGYLITRQEDECGNGVNAYHIDVWRKFYPACVYSLEE